MVRRVTPNCPRLYLWLIESVFGNQTIKCSQRQFRLAHGFMGSRQLVEYAICINVIRIRLEQCDV